MPEYFINTVYSSTALQMKGQWESNINVWFSFVYSHKWNCYFQNRIIMFSQPVPTLIYLWEFYIFPGYVCLFCCRKICGPILGIINRSQTNESGNWDWGRAIPRKGIHKWYFSCSVQRQGCLVLCRTQRRIYAVSFHHNYQAKDMHYSRTYITY